MPYEFYKVLHIFGLLLTFSGLAGIIAISINQSSVAAGARKFIYISHGVGLVILLVAGFGLAARLNLLASGIPTWIWIKLVIWLLIGGIVTLIKRKPQHAWKLYVFVLLLGTCAAYLAVNKP